MNIAYAQLVNPDTENALAELLKQKFPLRIVIKIRNIVNKLTEEKQKWEAIRTDLCKQYSKKDENNEPVTEEGRYVLEDETSFNAKMLELMNTEFYFDDALKIKISEIEGAMLTTLQLMAISFCVIDE